jgi:membrane protease YdiL (CAAX protease family)
MSNRTRRSAALHILGRALLALALTALGSGLWSGLFIANLKVAPDYPWASAVMLAALVALGAWLNGSLGPGDRKARRTALRLRLTSWPVAAWSLAGGAAGLAALGALWIDLARLQPVTGHANLGQGQLPWLTAAASILMASLSGAFTEEAGFRGYLQSALEARLSPRLAILISALAILPAHAATQGFDPRIVAFYLAVDAMLGTSAYVAQSILPGGIVHTAGLALFFTVIWPRDATRPLLAHGPDASFLLAFGVALAAGLFCIFAYGRALAARRTTQGAHALQATA